MAGFVVRKDIGGFVGADSIIPVCSLVPDAEIRKLCEDLIWTVEKISENQIVL